MISQRTIRSWITYALCIVAPAMLVPVSAPRAEARPSASSPTASGQVTKPNPKKKTKRRARRATPQRKTGRERRPPPTKPRTRTRKVERDDEAQKKIDEIISPDEAEASPTEATETEAAGTEEREALEEEDARDEDQVPPEPPAVDEPREVKTPKAYDSSVPPEERTYEFSIKDGTYEQLLEGFSRQTGVGLLGEPPKGKVSFVTTETMTFKQAMNRIRMLLFKYKPLEPYWLMYQEGYLEVIRVTDIYRYLPREQMFASVEAFREANLPDEELALVVYTPTSGSVSDLEDLRDFMPDYVRIAPNNNSMTIFALVKDINKYLGLIDFWTGVGIDDPRTIEKIEVEYIAPSLAIERLRNLMDLDGGTVTARASSRKRGGKDALAPIPEPPVSLLPDDEQKVIIVRAMQNKIDEIKTLLPYVDVDTSGDDLQPVVIPVEHAEVNELVQTINQILAASDHEGVSRATSARKPKKSQKSRKKTPTQASIAQTGQITMIPQVEANSIIVIADEEGVARVRRLVQQFDVEDRIGPVRIALENAEVEDAIAYLKQLLDAKPGGGAASILADPAGGALLVSGSAREVEKVREFVELVDIVEEPVELHIIKLVHQTPTFVANMLREYEGQAATPTTPAVKQTKKGARKTPRRRRASAPRASKFTGHDDTGRLYVWCTETEWKEYLPLIAQLDEEESGKPGLVRLIVENVTVSDAIAQITALVDLRDVRVLAASDAILLTGADEREIEEIRTVLSEIDVAQGLVQRTFRIEHADPADLIRLINTFTDSNGERTTPRRTTRKKGKKGDVATTVSATSDDLTIVQMNSSLVVETTPEKMEKVAALIAEFDVEARVTDTRTYDFPPGSNIDGVANTLSRVFGGSSAPRPKRGRGTKAAPVGQSLPMFLPQPASNKLLIIAEESQFAEIEELLDVLRGEERHERIETTFIPVEHVDAGQLVEQIEPLLRFKIRRLIAEGELDESAAEAGPRPPAKKRGRQTGTSSSEGFYMSADPRNRRIVIAAPQVVIDEAIVLVKDYDRPHEVPEIYKTIKLDYSEAEEVVTAVRGLMGAPTSSRARGGKGRQSAAPIAGSDDIPFTIVEAPGGGAVFVHGAVEDITKAEEWIAELDGNAGGRVIKVYEIDNPSVDYKLLADLIMNVADAPQTKSTPARSRPRRGGPQRESLTEEEEFSTTVTRTGRDIYLHADEIAGTVLVAAPAARIPRIDEVIEMFQADEEGGIPSQPSLPSMTYRLEFADAFKASFDLEMVLDVLWEPKDRLPKVDYFTFDNILVIKYPDESRFPEIEELIRKYVDIVDPEDTKDTRVAFTPPEGMTAQDAAMWLQLNNPGLKITLVPVGESVEDDHGIERLTPPPRANPCVLPASFQHALDALVIEAIAQVPEEEEEDPPPIEEDPDTEPLEEENYDGLDVQAAAALLNQFQTQADPEGGEESEEPREKRSLRGLDDKPISIVFDNETGALIVEGPAGLVEELSDSFKEMEEEIKKLGIKPDIRVYRVRHIGVEEAASILDQVFNASRREIQQQIRAQQQAQRRAQQQQRRQQQQRQRQDGRQGGDERGGQADVPGGRPGQPPQVAQPTTIPKMPSGVQIVPNPRDRTLIMRANTSDYPAILELLATIDQPQPIDRKSRTYRLTKLNATEVEEMLTEILGLGEKRSSSRPKTAGRDQRGAARPSTVTPGKGLPEPIMQDTTTGAAALGLTPEDITLKANPASNTIFAVAPEAALDYIGDLIAQLENEPIPERITEHYELAHADATEVADFLSSYFAESGAAAGRGKGRGRQSSETASLNTPVFLPYPRLNRLTAQATEEQIEKITELVAGMDVDTGEGKFEFVTLSSADARQMADTLGTMFGGAAGKGRGKAGVDALTPKFIGEDGSNVLIFSAPQTMRESILTAVSKIEEEMGGLLEPRVIQLEYATPSTVAEAIEAAYGMSRRGGRGKGAAPQARFSVAPNDATGRLYVVADDETFAKVESLAQSLDEPAKIGFDFRIYKLAHADARQAYEVLNKLVTDFVRMSRGGGKQIPAFSVEVDEKANALVVLGDETIFGFLEENLPKVDNPANAKSPPGFLMIGLKNADAREVAQNITRLWNQKVLPAGVKAPQAEANQSLNMLIVRGTQEQIDEIKREIIDPMEEYAPPALKTKTITLAFAQPEAVAESINMIFEDKRRAYQSLRGKGGISPLEFTVVVTPDVNTRQVIVQASEENMELIEARVAELDKEGIATTGALKIEIYPVKYADPNAVVNIITQWSRSRSMSGGRQRSVAARDVVTAVAEHATQSVVVTASEANHLIVTELIDGLDDDSLATRQRKMHVIQLKHANSDDVGGELAQVFRARKKRRGDAGPSFTSDPNTNSIVVSVNDEELAELRPLIELLDVPPEEGRQRQFRSFKLTYANPWSVQEAINRMFRFSRNPRDQVVAVPEWGSNAVIVSASPENIERVEGLVAELDKSDANLRTVTVIEIKNADPGEVARALNEIYVRSGPRVHGGQAPPISISELQGSKAVLVKANEEDLTKIRATITELDQDEFVASEIRIVQLVNSDATELLETIQEYLRKPGGARGRRGGGGGELVGDVRLSAMTQSNSLMISGEKDQVDRIESVVKDIDSMASDISKPQLVPLQYADANDILPTLQEMFVEQGGRRGRSGRGGGSQQAPVIVANESLNALLVKASPADFAQIESTIAILDTEENAGEPMLRIIRVAEGINVTDLANKLEDLFSESIRDRSGGGGRGRRGGGSQRQSISIEADTRTHSLLVSGSSSIFDEVEQTVRKLEKMGPPGGRATRWIRPTHLTAEEVRQLIEELKEDGSGSKSTGRSGRRSGGGRRRR
jgi:type II secretory pathway component GspD/PulD (secretin)